MYKNLLVLLFGFIGMSLYSLNVYENVLNMVYRAAGDEKAVKDYGYLIYCYASACYRKMGENADICLESAIEIDTENAETYINELLKN